MPAQCQKVKGKCQPFGAKHRTQALVNGGRNYNGPKVTNLRVLIPKTYASLSQTELYAGNPSKALSTRQLSCAAHLAVKILKICGQSEGKTSKTRILRDYMFGVCIWS